MQIRQFSPTRERNSWILDRGWKSTFLNCCPSCTSIPSFLDLAYYRTQDCYNGAALHYEEYFCSRRLNGDPCWCHQNASAGGGPQGPAVRWTASGKLWEEIVVESTCMYTRSFSVKWKVSRPQIKAFRGSSNCWEMCVRLDVNECMNMFSILCAHL